MDKIQGTINYHSQVTAGKNYENKRCVELRFFNGGGTTVVVVDPATAAKLINQLRRALDDDYNRLINERDPHPSAE